jgi:hypothetical protein
VNLCHLFLNLCTPKTGTMNLRKLTLVFLFFVSVSKLIAQDFTLDTAVATGPYVNPYTKSIGVKVSPGAITYKNMYKTARAIETIGYASLDGFSISILKEIYTPIEGAENLSWYIGYGGHMGVWSEEWKKTNPNSSNSNIAVGFDGILGFDYKIKNSPLNISVDWQPAFSIIQSYFKNHGGISVRYVLK